MYTLLDKKYVKVPKIDAFNVNSNASLFIGFDLENPEFGQLLSYTSQILVGAVTFVIAVLCIVGSYRILRRTQQETRLSSSTKQLYIKLLVILVIDVVLYTIVGYVPSLLADLMSPGSIPFEIMMAMPEFYDVIFNLLFFVYIKAYRDCILSPFKSLKNRFVVLYKRKQSEDNTNDGSSTSYITTIVITQTKSMLN
ncbi:hypothetical protein M3Y97_00937600 [Aphelenchoides bicaudatus]|nr:hypothetical protein M3Y97_00937600 [Aphelenchoides bicaudatus]